MIKLEAKAGHLFVAKESWRGHRLRSRAVVALFPAAVDCTRLKWPDLNLFQLQLALLAMQEAGDVDNERRVLLPDDTELLLDEPPYRHTITASQACDDLADLASRWTGTPEWHNPDFLDGEIHIRTKHLRAIAVLVQHYKSHP